MIYGTVTLTAEQTMCAVTVAALQLMRKVYSGRGDGYGDPDRSMGKLWSDKIQGMFAEVACCDILGQPWTPGGRRVSTGEVARKFEVRGTEHQHGHLLIYPEDVDESWFFLVVGEYPTFSLAGCKRAADCKRPELWRENSNPPAWWVPQADLLEPSAAGCEVAP